ncbi:MAG: substrate-binding domain-containing protein, partial [Oscillospiraceae bacterium]|nr:substrate-binding domain-containing protein [Oscillospiraceae bacterium]
MNDMKTKNRWIGLILAAGLTLTLAACGESSESSSSASESASASGSQTSESGGSSSLSGTVAVGGSTSMESVIGYLKESFTNENSGVTISYSGVGSGGGIEGVSNGTYDIGLSSRDLKEEETGLTGFTIALDGIVVIVNSACGVDNLTMDQITSIYSGETTNWSEVGGDDLEIALIGREESSGTRD